jgi:AraC-type DNA-binding domain-containing proteins
MNTNNLFFHIHYCKSIKANEPQKYPKKNVRTLQHHALILVKHGMGSVTIGKKKYPIKDGMLFYISPYVPHLFELDKAENLDILTVHFSYANVTWNEGKWAASDEYKTFSFYPAQELKDFYHVDEIFRKLVDCWNAKLLAYEFVAKTWLQQLLIAIFQNIRKQNQNYAISLKIEKVIEFMRLNINNKITLNELSELVQLAPTYLSRSFKEATGYSIIGLFNKMKIDKAKELMLEGNIKVKEVAQATGFTDEFYFSRIFKKIEGISPSEYCSKNVHET